MISDGRCFEAALSSSNIAASSHKLSSLNLKNPILERDNFEANHKLPGFED